VRPIGGRQPQTDRSQVIADGPLADPQDVADLSVRPPARNVPEHFEMPLGEDALVLPRDPASVERCGMIVPDWLAWGHVRLVTAW
jgi:hypothetical protein